MNELEYKFSNLVEALENSWLREEHFITFIYGECGEVRISYKDLKQKAMELLHGLQARGICEGDEVILQLDDNQNFLYVFWACILGGIIPVPVTVGNNDEHRMKLFKIWSILNTPFLVCDIEVLQKLEVFSVEHGLVNKMKEIAQRVSSVEEISDTGEIGRIAETRPENIAFIQFSSGSTGEPKGVVLTHENLVTNIKAMLKGIECSEHDSSLSWMPLTHDMGLIGFHLATLAANINQFLMPTALFIRRPSLWLKKASEHKVTLLSSPNFGYKYYMENHRTENSDDLDLSNVRLVFNGAEPISATICKEFLDKLEKYKLKRSVMFNVFGMAEACLAVSFPPIGEGLVGYTVDRDCLSVGDIARVTNSSDSITFVDLGTAVQDCFINIYSEDGLECGDGTLGYIHIKGKNVTSGYYNNREATLKAITMDGWLNTGDIGFMWKGRLVVTGRAKDIIFVNGQNYYPHDIENVCCELEGVEFGKVVVCGVLNNSVGREEIIIFIIYKKAVDTFIGLASEIKRYVGKKMGIEVAAVVPVKNIPKTTSGKIQRYKLGEDYKNGMFSSILKQMENKSLVEDKRSISLPSYSEYEAEILAICREVFKNKDIGIHDNIYELGVDSIKAVQVVSRLNEQGVYIDVNDILNHETVHEICSNLGYREIQVKTAEYDASGLIGANSSMVRESYVEAEKTSFVELKQEELDELFE